MLVICHHVNLIPSNWMRTALVLTPDVQPSNSNLPHAKYVIWQQPEMLKLSSLPVPGGNWISGFGIEIHT